jgi:hypothetical protein
VEEAVFAWAQKRFRVDETLWADDFWSKDSGVDIIQTLDGVVFSIQIKYITGRVRFKELADDFEQIKSIKDNGFAFEANTIVFVVETPTMALSLQGLMANYLPDFEVIVGYIGGKGEFIESRK